MIPLWLLITLAWMFGPITLLVALDLYHRLTPRARMWRAFEADLAGQSGPPADRGTWSV